tara:strand:- start:1665 stop:2483 length:819 start_codon:yes stop_codon:yes gene_type:complete
MFRVFLLIFCLFFSCNESKSSPSTLKEYLTKTFSHVAKIGDFYISAGNRAPLITDSPSATGKEIFDMSVRIFESLLDQDEDGTVDHSYLVSSLAEHLAFVIDHTDVTNKEEVKIESLFGNYVMTMKSNIWPYIPSFSSADCSLSLTELNTSLWRPETYNALWEECFHTVTEAINRVNPDFSFDHGSILGSYMQADIDNGSYDISEQNELEDDGYDFLTGVNEYVHQIWLINLCNRQDILNQYQLSVLEHISAVGIPLNVNPDYDLELGEIVK